MSKNISIDVVIPSYRLQSEYLLAMVEMQRPENATVHFYIVADNPEIQITESLQNIFEKPDVTLIKNAINLGAAQSRNAGIEAGIGDWILFLDDDVKPEKDLLINYTSGIMNHPEYAGFFGETVFPEPKNSFTHGLKVGGMLYFFEYASFSDEAKCATTSNVMIQRSAVGDVRFRLEFPKKGGGEDFAFFLEIFSSTGKKLKALSNTKVYHNWWNNGKRSYTQFFRWSFADYVLFRKFPGISYIDFPNIAEALFFSVLIGVGGLLFSQWWLLPVLVIGVLAGELLSESLNKLRSHGLRGVRYVHEVVLVRGSADAGRLMGLLKNRQWQHLLHRPNYSNYKVNIHFRKASGLKFLCYILFIVGIWRYFI
ncbi:MAG: glycosyltransferase family 2 protein [Cryomorphaceae bacterium]|nr:glycosyltransferase family 2 protein [Cryomorphaceae bacterium]